MDDRIARFHRLHAEGCFVMPNPWDVGSARVLEDMGFQALATTSAGFAWTLGRADNHITLDDALTHLETMAAAVSVPLNADFEGGFAVEPGAVACAIHLVTSCSPMTSGFSSAMMSATASARVGKSVKTAVP